MGRKLNFEGKQVQKLVVIEVQLNSVYLYNVLEVTNLVTVLMFPALIRG